MVSTSLLSMVHRIEERWWRCNLRRQQRQPRKISWRSVLFIGIPTVVFVVLGLFAAGSDQSAHGLGLGLSEDGRHLIDGPWSRSCSSVTPLGSCPVTLNREGVKTDLDARVGQEFTVMRTVAISNQAGGLGPNPYGDYPMPSQAHEQ